MRLRSVVGAQAPRFWSPSGWLVSVEHGTAPAACCCAIHAARGWVGGRGAITVMALQVSGSRRLGEQQLPHWLPCPVHQCNRSSAPSRSTCPPAMALRS